MSTQFCWKDVAQEPRHFYIAGDFNVELGFLCTDDDDVEELDEMYGPLCWQGCDTDQGGFKKLMRYEIMKEFNCKVTSTWSSWDNEREMAFTDREFGKGWKGRTTQLDYIIGPKRTSGKAFIRHDLKIWDSWDHYPIFASIHEEDDKKYFLQRRNGQFGGQ